jgi:hypothetical protein
MADPGRHSLRDALRRRSKDELRATGRPSSDWWGLADLWDVTDTHFCRPDEPLLHALGRWSLLLLRNAVRIYIKYFIITLLVTLAVAAAFAIFG